MTVSVLVPAHSMPHRTPIELMVLARRGLAEARDTSAAGQQYATAHLAALRAAAAVLASRGRPGPVRRNKRMTSVWELLNLVAPELSDWAGFFAAGAAKRSAAEAGIARISSDEAAFLLSHAETFIGEVQTLLELDALTAA